MFGIRLGGSLLLLLLLLPSLLTGCVPYMYPLASPRCGGSGAGARHDRPSIAAAWSKVVFAWSVPCQISWRGSSSRPVSADHATNALKRVSSISSIESASDATAVTTGRGPGRSSGRSRRRLADAGVPTRRGRTGLAPARRLLDVGEATVSWPGGWR